MSVDKKASTATVQRRPVLNVVLQRNDVLGRGAYGEVCRCTFGHLQCAGKILHELLESLDMIARFEEECTFISGLNHPNIVQYLGLHYEPETGAPVLLMELLDCNLTSYLSRLEIEPLPQKQQLDFCIDVSLALEFLHANEILHLDLSSNNILLRLSPDGSPVHVKVTDFGVSKIFDPNRFHAESNPCPGSLVYMPPEALTASPEFSSKLDVFSFGVLMIQIITTRFPNPAQQSLNMTERERRAEDLDAISTDNPIKPLIIDCLCDEMSERPSASGLCTQLSLIKNTDFYTRDKIRSRTNDSILFGGIASDDVKDEALLMTQCSSCEQFSQERNHFIAVIEELQEKLTFEAGLKHDYEKNFENCTHQVIELLGQNSDLRERNDDLHQQLISASDIIGDLHTVIGEQVDQQGEQEKQLEHASGQIEKLEKSLKAATEKMTLLHAKPIKQRAESVVKETKANKKESFICLQVDKPVPLIYSGCIGAMTSSGYKAYFMDRNNSVIFGYDSIKMEWFDLPACPVIKCGLIIVDGTLVTVGGELAGGPTNVLYSWSENQWLEQLPPMPTKRSQVGVTTDKKHVIVAGGSEGIWRLTLVVEVLNISTSQWQAVASLPIPLCRSTICVSNSRIYVLGGMDGTRKWQRRCFSASLSKLIDSSSHDWINNIPDLPNDQSSFVAKDDCLFSIGGCMPRTNTTVSDVYVYSQTKHKWIKVIGSLTEPRSQAFAVSLADKTIIVAGGRDNTTKCQSAQFMHLI